MTNKQTITKCSVDKLWPLSRQERGIRSTPHSSFSTHTSILESRCGYIKCSCSHYSSQFLVKVCAIIPPFLSITWFLSPLLILPSVLPFILPLSSVFCYICGVLILWCVASVLRFIFLVCVSFMCVTNNTCLKFELHWYAKRLRSPLFVRIAVFLVVFNEM